jgi:hypothetical protein
MVRKALVSGWEKELSDGCAGGVLAVRLFLTGISLVVLSPVEDFQRAGHVTEVEFILKGDEDLDRLEVESIRFLNDCTC